MAGIENVAETIFRRIPRPVISHANHGQKRFRHRAWRCFSSIGSLDDFF